MGKSKNWKIIQKFEKKIQNKNNVKNIERLEYGKKILR